MITLRHYSRPSPACLRETMPAKRLCMLIVMLTGNRAAENLSKQFPDCFRWEGDAQGTAFNISLAQSANLKLHPPKVVMVGFHHCNSSAYQYETGEEIRDSRVKLVFGRCKRISVKRARQPKQFPPLISYAIIVHKTYKSQSRESHWARQSAIYRFAGVLRGEAPEGTDERSERRGDFDH